MIDLTDADVHELPTATILLPILPGKLEAWFRFVQALMNRRRVEYEASRREMGVTRERFALAQAERGPMAVVHVEIADADRYWTRLAQGEEPFDRWFRRQWRELHGVELVHCRPAEPVASWAAE